MKKKNLKVHSCALKKGFVFFVLSLISFAFLSAQTSKEQQYHNNRDSVYALKEVSVTSSMPRVKALSLDVPSHYLPVTTSRVSAKNLQMRSVSNIQDAVKFIPGLRMRTTYGGFQQLAIRGFDFSPIMIDGIRDQRTSISNSAPFPDLSSVEFIELVRGASSVLYGHSAVGGMLNVVSRSPRPETSIDTKLSYGSWNNKEAMIGFGGNIVKGLNYQATANYGDNEGWRYTNDQRFSGYLALGYEISKTQSVELKSRFNRDSYGLDMGLVPLMKDDILNLDGSSYLTKGDMLPNLNNRARYNNQSDKLINNGSSFVLGYKNQISDKFKLENTLAYTYDNTDYQGCEAFYYLESAQPIYSHYYMKGGAKQYINLDTITVGSPYRFAYTLNVINNKLELSSNVKLGNMVNHMLGGYEIVIMNRDTYRGKGIFNGPGLTGKVTVKNPESAGYIRTDYNIAEVTRYTTHGIYFQDLLEVNEHLKLMLAGRFDTYSYKYADADIVNGQRKYTNRKDYKKTTSNSLTYRAGFVYLPQPQLSIYGSVANFYIPYRDLYNDNIVYVNASGNRFYPKEGGHVLKPQSGYQIEVGSKYTLHTTLEASASFFYIRKNNEKKTIGTLEEDDITKNVVGQVGTSDSKGFELELMYKPLSNLNLSFGYALTDARVRKIKKNDYMKEEVNKGTKLPFIPNNTFFSYGDLTIEKGFFKNLGFNYTISYMDHIYRSLNKDLIYPAHWLVDLGVSYQMKNNITLSFIAKNLFDESYSDQSMGSRQIIPGLPRNYVVSVAYKLH